MRIRKCILIALLFNLSLLYSQDRYFIDFNTGYSLGFNEEKYSRWSSWNIIENNYFSLGEGLYFNAGIGKR